MHPKHGLHYSGDIDIVAVKPYYCRRGELPPVASPNHKATKSR
jgi:hypothetical protein